MGHQTPIAMTTQESKLVEKLERRLQENAVQKNDKTYRQGVKEEGLHRTPLRIPQQTIQRAQFYTGDA